MPRTPSAQSCLEHALDQRGSGAPREAPADRKQPEKGDEAVAQEIEGVGLQRLGACDEAADHLGHAHRQVQKHDDPERPPIARRGMRNVGPLARVSATVSHSDAPVLCSRKDRGCTDWRVNRAERRNNHRLDLSQHVPVEEGHAAEIAVGISPVDRAAARARARGCSAWEGGRLRDLQRAGWSGRRRVCSLGFLPASSSRP